MTTEQLIILVAIVAAVCIVGVICLIFHFKKNKKTPKQEVAPIKIETKSVPEAIKEEKAEPVEIKTESDSFVEDEEEEESEEDFQAEEEPEKVVQVVNGRKIFVQYNYSFKAKLILSSEEVQNQYRDLINHIRCYAVKTSLSWKQERIYLGRNTYAMLLFKGKKLCVAYALDPKEYEETKYHVLDLSEVKRFVKTPTLLKISSERKRKYALDLLDVVLTANGFTYEETTPEFIDIPKMTKEELIDEHLIKVYSSEEVTEGAIIEQASVSDLIRKNVTMTEAKGLITDDSAFEYIQVENSKEKKTYTKKDIINIDVLSKNFSEGDLVDIQSLKEKNLISKKVDYIKVLARGVLDKSLVVELQDFSIDAVKMIVLTGGEVRKVN
ncbi:MAG: uL15 family ribosomal protein [Anaeroplasmataceae bacterium]|nr:uL15 family ribosomal protein [Anaeroplasmataceae bacterium]